MEQGMKITIKKRTAQSIGERFNSYPRDIEIERCMVRKSVL